MKWKTIAAEYFTFSKIQRRSIIIALSFIFACLALRFSYRYFAGTETIPADTAFLQQAARLTQPDTSRNAYTVRYSDNRYSKNADEETSYREPADKYTTGKYKSKGELFPFDPNTLGADGWKRLGLRDKTIGTIQNYLAKGGHFRQPTDLKRVYGLFPDEANRLIPFVRIATPISNYNNSEKVFTKTETQNPAYKSTIPKPLDINIADTAAFIALPGIGSKLASRIVGFREKLGGFYSVDQLAETYGLPDSTFQKIKPRLTVGASSVKRININTADANALKANPYIRWNVANAIFQYRQQHGHYAELNDLKKIALIDEQLFLKIQPYLTVE